MDGWNDMDDMEFLHTITYFTYYRNSLQFGFPIGYFCFFIFIFIITRLCHETFCLDWMTYAVYRERPSLKKVACYTYI